MLKAKEILDRLASHGFDFFAGTPCSMLQPLIDEISLSKALNYMAMLNEGDATAVATGAYLSGKKSVVLFQNSGLGNAVNPITSLVQTFKIPLLFIVSLRKDEPQHQLMGENTVDLIKLMGADWAYLPSESDKLHNLFLNIDKSLAKNRSFFLILEKGVLESEKKRDQISKGITRREALKLIQEQEKNSIIISTTGKTSREFFELEDNLKNFYMVGSMGCASAIGLGIAVNQNHKHTIVIDGDGAILMRLQNMAQIGLEKPKNLTHLVLDNEVHDSTGAQVSGSKYIDLALIARAVGYKKIYDINDLKHLAEALKEREGPVFIRMKISIGSPSDLSRPSLKPAENAQRLRHFLLD